MSRVARQPVWWIVLTIAYFAINALSLVFELQDLSPFHTMRLFSSMIVVVGAIAFAFGYRIGSPRLWWAVAILYASQNIPYLTGIVFRLARFAVNPDYHVYRSTSSYFVTIFLVTYEALSLLRILQSFRDEKALADTFR